MSTKINTIKLFGIFSINKNRLLNRQIKIEPVLFYNYKRDIFRYLKSIFHVKPEPTQENLDDKP